MDCTTRCARRVGSCSSTASRHGRWPPGCCGPATAGGRSPPSSTSPLVASTTVRSAPHSNDRSTWPSTGAAISWWSRATASPASWWTAGTSGPSASAWWSRGATSRTPWRHPADELDLRRGRRIALLNVANWWPNKGVLELLDAVATLPSDRVTLHLVGREDVEPGYGRRVHARLRAPDLAGRVVVHGAAGTGPARPALRRRRRVRVGQRRRDVRDGLRRGAGRRAPDRRLA